MEFNGINKPLAIVMLAVILAAGASACMSSGPFSSRGQQNKTLGEMDRHFGNFTFGNKTFNETTGNHTFNFTGNLSFNHWPKEKGMNFTVSKFGNFTFGNRTFNGTISNMTLNHWPMKSGKRIHSRRFEGQARSG